MIAFLKKQLENVEAEIQQFIIDRGRASIETVGSYEIMIERKKKERLKLIAEIEELENSTSSNAPKPSMSSHDIAKIKQLIQRNNIEQAINIMLQKFPNNQSISTLSTKFHSVKRDNLIGILSYNEYQIASNKITYGLLSLLNDL